MSKFKAGDVVVCMVSDDSFDTLETGRSYTVKSSEDWTVELEEIPHREFGCARFEHIEEWAKHQRAVSMEDEMTMLKIQVKMLQDGFKQYRQESKYLLRYARTLGDSNGYISYVNELDYFLEHDKLEVLK